MTLVFSRFIEISKQPQNNNIVVFCTILVFYAMFSWELSYAFLA